jgi:hypothetical protein
MNTPQGFPLYATAAGEEYLVVGWTSYNAPELIPLDKPANRATVVPTDNIQITYSLRPPGGYR